MKPSIMLKELGYIPNLLSSVNLLFFTWLNVQQSPEILYNSKGSGLLTLLQPFDFVGL